MALAGTWGHGERGRPAGKEPRLLRGLTASLIFCLMLGFAFYWLCVGKGS